MVGLALALAGTAAMVRASFALDGAHVLGDALGVATALFYTAYLLLLKRLRQSLSALAIMAWSTAITSVCLLPAAVVAGEALVAATWSGWAVLVAIAWVSHVGGQGLIAFALAHLPASFSSVALLVQPVSAAILAWILLGEALGGLQAVGAAVVIAGILVARRASLAPGAGA